MAGFNVGFLGLAPKSWNKAAGKFFKGTPGKVRQISTLRPYQEPLHQQMVNAALGPNAGGAFGTAADYYRNLMSPNPEDFQAFAAPEMRNYYENIVPNISEQFAGMGSGGLSSSGFRNAQTQGGVDLAERLANMRANLRQAGAAGLANIGQLGLQSFQTTHETPGTPGLLSKIAPALGTAAGAFFGGPAGAAIGNITGNWFGNSGNKVGANTSPYNTNSLRASPQIGFQLPSFQSSMQRY